MKDIKLLLVYEENAKNNKIKNRIPYKRDYELELKNCINAWKRYYDYEILVISNIDLKIPDVLTHKMNFDELDSKYGFVNIYPAGKKAHELYPNSRFVHIDLDMYLQRKLPNEIFETNETIIGVYSEEDEFYQRKKKFGNKLAETDFIVTSSAEFYNDYLRVYNNVKKILVDVDEYDVEEYVADYLLNKNNYKIFERYEIGEGFYNKIINPYFIHCHLRL